jgi:Ca2+-binding EF-hand superfamily protein
MSLRLPIKQNKCKACEKTVYPEEGFALDSAWYHSACFKCDVCKGRISPGNYASLQGKYYCKIHFKQLFALKGNYDEGFGRAQHKDKWLPGGAKLSILPGSPGAPIADASAGAGAGASVAGVAGASPVAPPAAAPEPPSPSAPVEPSSPKLAVDPASPPQPMMEPMSPSVASYVAADAKLKSMPIKLSGLTLEDVEAAQVEFKRINTSESGAITKDEFLVLITEVMEKKGKSMGKRVLESTASGYFNGYDRDKNGVIDEAEFLQIYSDLLLDKDKRKPASPAPAGAASPAAAPAPEAAVAS